MNIALVDRIRSETWYTMLLSTAIQRQVGSGSKVIIYCPKSSVESPIAGEVPRLPVWSELAHPVQIATRSIRDRVDLVHLQFEFETFGKWFTSYLVVVLIALLRISRRKVVTTIHGPFYQLEEPGGWTAERGLNSRLLRAGFDGYIALMYRLLGLASCKVIVHARVFERRLRSIGVRNCVVIHHGLESRQSGSRGAVARDQRPVILFFGVISPRKGIEILLEAYSNIRPKHPKSTLSIAGGESPLYPQYSKSLEQMARRIEISDSVKFMGWVPDSYLEDVFLNSTLLVMPYRSSVSASGPLSLASKYGLPVIVSKTAYFAEVLSPELNEAMFDAGDPSSLAKALDRVLSDAGLRRRIEDALDEKSKMYSWESSARQTVRLYSSLEEC